MEEKGIKMSKEFERKLRVVKAELEELLEILHTPTEVDTYVSRDIEFFVEHKINGIWHPVFPPDLPNLRFQSNTYRWYIPRVHDVFRLLSVGFDMYSYYEECYYLKPDIRKASIRKYDCWPPDLSDYVQRKIGPTTFVKASLTLTEMLSREDDLIVAYPYFSDVILTEMKKIDNNYNNVRAVFGF